MGCASFRAADYKSLNYKIDIKQRGYILMANHYYNGFQFNDGKQRYESDGGAHFPYGADEALLVFDFTSLIVGSNTSKYMIKEAPHCFMDKPGHKSKEEVEATFRNVILTTKTVTNIPPESHILCDWKWATEN